MTQSRWISVNERLPEDCVRVMVLYDNYNYMDIDWYDHGFECWVSELRPGWTSKVTHWMPLPEPIK